MDHVIWIQHQAEPDAYPKFTSDPMTREQAEFWATAMQDTLDIDFEIWAAPIYTTNNGS
jgi:hypothetical protein